MLAKAVATFPEPDSVAGGLGYEPKWEGRYVRELTAALADLLPHGCVLDGEIVVRSGLPGAERLDGEALAQRIHPAESRIDTLSVDTPANFIACATRTGS